VYMLRLEQRWAETLVAVLLSLLSLLASQCYCKVGKFTTQVQHDLRGEGVPSSTMAQLEAEAVVGDGEDVHDGPRLYPPKERSQIRESWRSLMRWSKV
jgi:hypothetical protein